MPVWVNHASSFDDKLFYLFHSQATEEHSVDNGHIASPSHHDDLDSHAPRENSIPPQDEDCDMAKLEEKSSKVGIST